MIFEFDIKNNTNLLVSLILSEGTRRKTGYQAGARNCANKIAGRPGQTRSDLKHIVIDEGFSLKSINPLDRKDVVTLRFSHRDREAGRDTEERKERDLKSFRRDAP